MDPTAALRASVVYNQAAVVICTPGPSSLRSSGNYPRSGVVGDVYRSTPCSVGRKCAVISFRHTSCFDAHDVPLRGW